MSWRNPSFVLFRGLACPYEVSVLHHGQVLTVAQDAFQVDPNEVEVQLFEHGGEVLLPAGAGGLRFWQNRVGLCFEVALPASFFLGEIRHLTRRWGAGVSVGFSDTVAIEHYHLGRPHRRIVRTAIDHFTLCDDPAFPTGIWLAAEEEAGGLPAHHQKLARACAEGRDQASLAVHLARGDERPVALSSLGAPPHPVTLALGADAHGLIADAAPACGFGPTPVEEGKIYA